MKAALTQDLPAKIIAVILALIVWTQVISDKNPIERRTFVVDVVPTMVEEGMMIISTKPDKVSVTLEGRARTLDEIEPNKLKAEVDLSAVEPGSFVADLRVEIPAGVKVVELDASSVTFELDMVSSCLLYTSRCVIRDRDTKART